MMPDSPSCEFQDQLTAFLPKMRVWAMALTRNRAAAEDLVQDVAMKALAASESFVPDTNFSAWVHRIMTNHFISGARSRREYSDLDQVPEVGIAAAQHDRTELRELNVAFQRLPREQKEALRMIGIEERSYEEAAGATGCAVGTLKSRVHRARLNLRSIIHGETRAAA
jgi:RNA polymerase sigma-70 factor (ECF subfamily)